MRISRIPTYLQGLLYRIRKLYDNNSQIPLTRGMHIEFVRNNFKKTKMSGIQVACYKEYGGQGGQQKEEGHLVQGKEKLDCC